MINSWTLKNKLLPDSPLDTGRVRKCGYLLKKYNQSIGAALWIRRYFVLENGRIFYYFLADSIRSPKVTLQTLPVNVLLCNTKMLKREERRFVFEIVNPTRQPWILQGILVLEFINRRK